ncbi:MAG: hypothetical protein N3I35_15350 [Clostridia bacterium]|nr:hypothetical protein [Clostridia bacterium]
MAINICPVQDNSLNCVEMCVASVLLKYNRDYTLMFSDVWGAEFEQSVSLSEYVSLSEKLKLGRTGRIWELIEKFYGVKVSWINAHNINNLYDILYKQLELGIPIGLLTSGYFCPWSDAYQKYDIPHAFLVIGIDNNSNNLLCMDPYFSLDIKNIELNVIVDNVSEVFIFQILGDGKKILIGVMWQIWESKMYSRVRMVLILLVHYVNLLSSLAMNSILNGSLGNMNI